MTVNDIYARVCLKFLEPLPLGLSSGIFTVSDFLDHFASVAPDFYEKSGYVKMVVTQAINFSISQYEVPDQMSHVDNCFVSGRLLRRESLESLNTTVSRWRTATGIPRSYHEDGLPVKTIELYPSPNYQGDAMPTSGADVFQSPETGTYFQVGGFFPKMRNLTLTGSQVPLNDDLTPKTSWTLTDTITGLPDSAAVYLSWGVLAKMYSDDSEAKDEQRAQYCAARYDEGVSLFKTIVAERGFEDPDNSL